MHRECLLKDIPLDKRGIIHRFTHESDVLKDNFLKDPYIRELAVYIPQGYNHEDKSKKYPVFLDLTGFAGCGLSHLNWEPFIPNFKDRLDYLIYTRKMGESIVIFPNTFTKYGGNQYLNSPAVGNYMDYIIEEIVPFAEDKFNTYKNKNYRAVFGKSSGGYGALVHGLMKPDFLGAIACLSGGAYFESWKITHLYTARKVIERHGCTLEGFFSYLEKNQHNLTLEEVYTLFIIASGATYAPDESQPFKFKLPFKNISTGELDHSVLEKWYEKDPVRMLDTYGENLRKLKGIYIDCGIKDDLICGNRILHKRLNELNILHEYQEFDDGHSDIDYRNHIRLPYLYKSLFPDFK
ncbi:alpha/beta hydrolase-fold protein [Francisella sp. 19X1-34]|uniref:alpha/beta hydrolase n=1 Tax=Francisella sp. 19X1-34 TaxID=3087177 RepID=UPI002E36F1E1|nr:alpha/beta hydrolase-fold protein [Francisella sp. 19X1-34]MED7788892.1 alpha/beta hydrolase-fold protein [Francisella sp. 19X1-34]